MLLYHIFLMNGGFFYSLRNVFFEKVWDISSPPKYTVTILIPAYNEELVIENTIKSMISQNYPKDKLEVIIINDSSSDNTQLICESYAHKYSFINVVNTPPSTKRKGKSVALNYGLAQANGEIIIVYDADNTPEQNAVRNLVLVLENHDNVGAVVGKFRVNNADRNILTRFINIETLTFQWLAQAGRWFWFKLTTIPGTNFAIRKSLLDELGGWDEGALSEDTELTIRVYNLGYNIMFYPAAVTWEQEPETWRVWWKQRTRWVRGNLYVIGKYIVNFNKLSNRRVVIDLLYFLFTYFLFIGGILTSHSILIASLFIDLELKIGFISYVLLIVGFLLFLTELLLAISLEKDQLNFKNFITIIIMYFTYSQIWLLLVLQASILQIKGLVLHEETTWYKTQRYKQEDTHKD